MKKKVLAVFLLFGIALNVNGQLSVVSPDAESWDDCPHFNGCADEDFTAGLGECTEMKFFSFFYGNFKVPESIKENKQEGVVEGEFSVDVQGQTDQVTITKGFEASSDDEVKRVLNMLPKWKPADLGGQSKSAKFKFKIKIRA